MKISAFQLTQTEKAILICTTDNKNTGTSVWIAKSAIRYKKTHGKRHHPNFAGIPFVHLELEGWVRKPELDAFTEGYAAPPDGHH